MFKSKKNRSQASDIPHVCKFCEYAAIINDEYNVLCSKKGIVNREYCCKSYSYDPLKRVPKTLPPMPTLSEEDLLL